MKTKRQQRPNNKGMCDKNDGNFSISVCRQLGFVSSKQVLSMNDSQKVLVHSGMVCARLHALRGNKIRAEKIIEIENKVYKDGRRGVATLVTIRKTRRVKLTVGEIRTLFNDMDFLPRTTFMINR